MSSALILFAGLIIFYLGFRYYGNFLGEKVFKLNEHQDKTPAHTYSDGVDFVPTSKKVLFGHHFSSIAGAAPIIGPAVAVIWGWGPALFWVVFGVVFMGAGHDLGALALSMKFKGKSMGQVAEHVLGPQVRTLFLIIIFFLVLMVIAVFTLVIAGLFMQFPSSVLPVNFEIIIAILMGIFINKKNKNLLIPSLVAQALLLVTIYLGQVYPITITQFLGIDGKTLWMIILLGYSFIASVLPVWLLLQPRDFINGHQLLLGLTLMILGVFVTRPEIVAPVINLNPEGAPSLFPFIFITIACGAISGFHGLVSSGTTSKQVGSWKDVTTIGYGGMILEGLLALLATLAVASGFDSTAQWHQHYASWNAANGLSAKIGVFVLGSGRFLGGLGIPESYAHTIMAVLIISFAATSLDTASRIQRYIVGEIGEALKIPVLKNKYVGSTIAVGSAALLMILKGGGKGGLYLWPLFGSTNQMLAGLSLLVITVYLSKDKINLNYFIPAVFVLVVTSFGLGMNIYIYFTENKWFLLSLGLLLFVAQGRIIWEAHRALKVRRK